MNATSMNVAKGWDRRLCAIWALAILAFFFLFMPVVSPAFQGGTTFHINTCTNLTCTAAPSSTVCSGVGDDKPTMQNFTASALAWQTGGGTGLITLILDLGGSALSVSNITYTGTTVTVTTSATLPSSWSTVGQWVWFYGVGGTTVLNRKSYAITYIDSTDFSVTETGNAAFTSGGFVSSNLCMTTDGNGGNYFPFGSGTLNIKITSPNGTLDNSMVGFSGGATAGYFQLGSKGSSTVGPAGLWSARIASVAAGATSVTLLPTLSLTANGPTASNASTTLTMPANFLGIATSQVVACPTAYPSCGIQSGTTVTAVGTNQSTATLSLQTTAQITSTSCGGGPCQITFTTTTATECSLFNTLGQYHMLGNYDMQGSGYPPNQNVYEYPLVTGCSGNVVSVSAPLAHSYVSTAPVYNIGNPSESDQGGPGTMFYMDESFTTAIEYDGIAFTQAFAATAPHAHQLTINNSIGCVEPSEVGVFSTNNFDETACALEIDKDNVTMTLNCTVIQDLYFQSESVYNTTISSMSCGSFNSSILGSINGSPKSLTITGGSSTVINSLNPGTYVYGQTGTASINASVASWGSFGINANGISSINGVITWPNSNGPAPWAFPGVVMYQRFAWGAPFTITGLTQDATNTYITTTLTTDLNNADITTYPVRSFTCTSCTGSATSVGLSGFAVAGLWSTSSTTFTPVLASRSYPGPLTIGQVQSIGVNVVTPYTGVGSTLTMYPLSINGGYPFYSPSSVKTFYAGNVNLKIAGNRVCTPNGCTGLQTGDTAMTLGGQQWVNNASYSPLISSDISSECSSTPSVCPTVIITVNTNQAQQFPGGTVAGPGTNAPGVRN